MGIGKIFIGVVIIVIGVVIWMMLATPQGALTQVLFSTPGERMAFTEQLAGLQLLYFLAVIGAGVGIIIWGAQS